MKKVTSKETIDFLVSGIRGSESENVVVINSKGVIVDDSTAVAIAERFGGLVEITNADTKDVKKAAKDAVEGDDTPEDETEDEETPEKPNKTSKK